MQQFRAELEECGQTEETNAERKVNTKAVANERYNIQMTHYFSESSFFDHHFVGDVRIQMN